MESSVTKCRTIFFRYLHCLTLSSANTRVIGREGDPTCPTTIQPCQIIGERRLFIRMDELDAAWPIFTPLLRELEERCIAPELYPYGSRGPVGAHYLAAKYNVHWGDLSIHDS